MSLRRGPALIPIGTFSSVTHLTQKTLRFYAEQGILNPAWVDPENGYRYYRTDQITQARRIQMLREIGMSLAEVETVNLACQRSPEAASQLVHRHFMQRQAQFQCECETYRSLVLGLLDDQPMEGARAREVHSRSVPGGPVLAIHSECSMQAMHDTIGQSVDRLLAITAEAGVQARGAPFIRHATAPFLELKQIFQTCLPIEHRITPPDGVRLWRDRPHREAWVATSAHDAEYPNYIPVIESLVDWLVDNQRIFVGFAVRVVLAPEHPTEFVWPFVDPEDEDEDFSDEASA